MINLYVEDIQRALKNKCYFSAMALALALPDICGAAEFSDDTPVAKRYIEWYDKYVFPMFDTSDYEPVGVNMFEESEGCDSQSGPHLRPECDGPDLTGEVVYNLRNTYLHQGSPTVNREKVKEERNQVDGFELMLGEGTGTWGFSLAMIGNLNAIVPGGSVAIRFITVDLTYLCTAICSAALKYYQTNQDKFSFRGSVVTQETVFNRKPPDEAKEKKHIEIDVIGKIMTAKMNERLEGSNRTIAPVGNLTKDVLEGLKVLSAKMKEMERIEKNTIEQGKATENHERIDC